MLVYKFLQERKEERTLANLFYEFNNNLIPKPDKETTTKHQETCKPLQLVWTEMTHPLSK